METDAFLQSCLPCRHQVKSDQAGLCIRRGFSYGGGKYLSQVLRAVISHFARPGSQRRAFRHCIPKAQRLWRRRQLFLQDVMSEPMENIDRRLMLLPSRKRFLSKG